MNPRLTALRPNTSRSGPPAGTFSLETIKNVVTIAGGIAAAIWAVYTFIILQERREAEAQIAQLELQTKNFPLNINIAKSVAQLDGSRVLMIDATLSNPGAGPLTLYFQCPVFRLAKVHLGKPLTPVASGSPLFFSNAGAGEVQERRLLGKQERHMPYAFSISEPGLYLIQVDVGYADERRLGDPTLAFEQAIVLVE